MSASAPSTSTTSISSTFQPDWRAATESWLASTSKACGPIAFRLDDGRAYTYSVTDDGIAIEPGHEKARTIIELTHEDWCEFVWELRTCFALFYADR